MGYSTDFSGVIKIEPALPVAKVIEVNAFCEERHGGNTQPFDGMPGFWCNLKVTDGGGGLCWNGSEKTYYLEKWVRLLISKFFEGHILNGQLTACGEDSDDRWLLVVKDNVVSRKNGRVTYE